MSPTPGPPAPMPAECRDVRDRSTPYLDGELAGTDTARVRAHLDACPPCAAFLDREERWGRLVRRGMKASPASPRLRQRIEAALDEADAGSGAARSTGWPVLALAASLLLAAVLIGGAAGRLWGPDDPGSAEGPEALVPITRLAGVVVDVECDRLGKPYDMQRNCSHPDHAIGLRCEGDRYYRVSLSGGAGRGMFARPHCGREIVVSGFERRGDGLLMVREATWATLAALLI